MAATVRRPGPRHGFRAVVLGLGILSLVVAGGLTDYLQRRGDLPVAAAGIGLGPGGTVQTLAADDRPIPGSRVLSRPGGSALAAAQRRWLRDGTIPGGPGLDDLVRGALLDLQVLTRPYGVAVAGWAPPWHYVWPRDAAFVASAFARTGHIDEARATLDFLQAVQRADGEFEARYTPKAQVAPGGRARQLDGTGWALWALGEVAAQLPADQRRRLIGDYSLLLDRSVAAALRLTSTPNGLPPASPDYWEVPERRPTLATAAILLAGLRHAEVLYTHADALAAAAHSQEGGRRLERAVLAAFGPAGFPRRLGGSPASVDLGVAFLLPPFAGVDSAAIRRAWRRAPDRMARPAGGLAPGGSWPKDGISWTPTVATYAMVAACVEPAEASRWLAWLAEHRTPTGAMPEKVRADGAPAGVAPLAWTAAATVIAADELDRGCGFRRAPSVAAG